MFKQLMKAIFGEKRNSENTDSVRQVIGNGSNNVQQVVRTSGDCKKEFQRDNKGNIQIVSFGDDSTHVIANSENDSVVAVGGGTVINSGSISGSVKTVKITAGTNTIITPASSGSSNVNTTVGTHQVVLRMTPSSLQIEACGHQLNITGEWYNLTRSYVVGPVSIKLTKGKIDIQPE